MNLHQPRVFCSVVKYRSYTRAAEVLFMTQPAVSLQIQALEKSLQVKLLERVKGELIVTEAGQALYQCALPMLNAEEEAKRVSRTRRLIEQTLRERGYTLADASHLQGIELVKKAVESFLGVVIVSSAAVQREVEVGALCAVPIAVLNLTRPVAMFYRQGKYFGPMAQHFMAHARQFLSS